MAVTIKFTVTDRTSRDLDKLIQDTKSVDAKELMAKALAMIDYVTSETLEGRSVVFEPGEQKT